MRLNFFYKHDRDPTLVIAWHARMMPILMAASSWSSVAHAYASDYALGRAKQSILSPLGKVVPGLFYEADRMIGHDFSFSFVGKQIDNRILRRFKHDSGLWMNRYFRQVVEFAISLPKNDDLG